MEKPYRDRDWLYKMYWIKKLSIPQIAKEIDVSNRTIWEWLNKFSFPSRSRGEGCHLRNGNHCKLSKKAIEWLNGELLGDGCVYSRHPYSANFRYSSKYLEYAQYISDTLKFFGIEQVGKIYKQYYKRGVSYYYASRDYTELLPIRKQWYPENKKIVPKDIELTPLICRHWYIGDGYLAHPQNSRPHIVLYTNGFSIDDVEWLASKLIELNFKATRQPSNNIIYMSPYSTQNFLNYIGKCPIECYNYKWNY